MPIIRCAFLNCWNLFPLGADRCAQQTAQELDAKVVNLAETLRAMFPVALPDVIGLCEVGDSALGGRVADALSNGLYKTLWSGPPPRNETGILILFNPSAVLPTLAHLEVGPVLPAPAIGSAGSSSSQRARWMAAEFQLQIGSRAAFWMVVCHWKSHFGQGEWMTMSDRMQSAREIGSLFLRVSTSTANMLVMGDLNCEPGDRPLKSQYVANADPHKQRPNQLRAFRQHRRVLNDNKKLAYFYNPMWRLMGEPDHFEVAGRVGYNPPRVMGTHGPAVSGGTEWLMFDQLMVSKRMLRGGQMILRESSVAPAIALPVQGCSDHCAIGAEFDCA